MLDPKRKNNSREKLQSNSGVDAFLEVYFGTETNFSVVTHRSIIYEDKRILLPLCHMRTMRIHAYGATKPNYHSNGTDSHGDFAFRRREEGEGGFLRERGKEKEERGSLPRMLLSFHYFSS